MNKIYMYLKNKQDEGKNFKTLDEIPFSHNMGEFAWKDVFVYTRLRSCHVSLRIIEKQTKTFPK